MVRYSRQHTSLLYSSEDFCQETACEPTGQLKAFLKAVSHSTPLKGFVKLLMVYRKHFALFGHINGMLKLEQ